MAQKLRVVKEEIWDLFYDGYTKQEIKEKKFPNIPQNVWNKIWKAVGLHNKRVPEFTYEVVSKEDTETSDNSTSDDTNPGPGEEYQPTNHNQEINQ